MIYQYMRFIFPAGYSRNQEGVLMKAKCSARLLLHMIGAVMALLSHQNASAGQLQVSADFDNGRVKVINIDQQTRTIETTIPDDNHTQHTQMRYWHYRINGITPGELITIKHSPSTTSLYYAYSYDGKEWFRFGKSGINPIQHRFDSSSVELSPNFAYPYSRSIAFCDSIEALGLAHAQVSTLAISEEGREVKMLRITDPSVSDDTKRIVWIQGRQHAFESASSFIPE